MSALSILQATSDVEYREIPGFPGYAVGADGRIWSCNRTGPGTTFGAWRQLAGGTDKDGYKKIILCRDGKRRYAMVHVVVLECFVGPCPEGMESRHYNNDRADNRLSNLSWATHTDNLNDKVRHGTFQQGSKIGNSIIDEATAAAVKRLLAAGICDAAIVSQLGVPRTIVYNIKKGISWKHVEI